MMAENKKSTRPLLTVIYPFLNASEDVEECFRALKHQKNVNKNEIEVIIVNDGSLDNTDVMIKNHISLLSKYSAVRVINHTQRLGLTRTRLDGANEARGEFITFLDKKCRPDEDYLSAFISKGCNIIIGNPYIDKTRSTWSRALSLVRKKLYFPYFNHEFSDILLDPKSYQKFKNKGGGGSMFVKKTYYLRVAASMPTGIHVNDDSLFVLRLSEIEPILKTASAKIEYINRVGFMENVVHLYGRGPKFVDFYATPGTRFFPLIIGLVPVVLLNIGLLALLPVALVYEVVIALAILLAISLYLAEDVTDYFVMLLILPIATLSFSAGVLKGLALKVSGKL